MTRRNDSEATGALAQLTLDRLPPPSSFGRQVVLTNDSPRPGELKAALANARVPAVFVEVSGAGEVRGYIVHDASYPVLSGEEGVHPTGPRYTSLRQWSDLEGWSLDVEKVWISPDLDSEIIPERSGKSTAEKRNE